MSYRHVAFFAIITAGCSTAAEPAGESATQDLVGDIASMTARGDGSFDVVCRDGVKEIATASNISAGNVCVRAGAGACSGTPMTTEQALAKIPAGQTETALGRVTFEARAPRFENGHHSWFDTSYESNGSGPITTFRVNVRIKDGSDTSRDVVVTIPLAATLVLRANDGNPSLRIVSDAATVPGADTTRLVRIVSNDIRLANMTYAPSVDYEVETATAAPGSEPVWRKGNWQHEVEAQYSVRYSDGSGSYLTERIYPLIDPRKSVVTERCARLTFREDTSSMAAVSPILNVSASFATE